MDIGEHWLDEFCRVVVYGYDAIEDKDQAAYRDVWREQAQALHASATRGAVEALERIASDDCMIVRGETGGWIDTGAPQRIAQDALADLRGQ